MEVHKNKKRINRQIARSAAIAACMLLMCLVPAKWKAVPGAVEAKAYTEDSYRYYTDTQTGVIWGYIVKEDDTAMIWLEDNGDVTDLIVPDYVNEIKVTELDGRAFWCHTEITSVSVPATVTAIGDDVFYRCRKLKTITVDENNPKYKSDGSNAIIERDTNVLVVGCYNTKIPNYVTEIGRGAFTGCDSLESITFPASVKRIGLCAFSECASLKDITLPSTVTYIGDSAFSGCDAVKTVAIVEGVTNIGKYAFNCCTGLESISFPASASQIGEGVIGYCKSLQHITVAAGNPKYRAENENTLVDKETNTLLAICKGADIPAGVTRIGASAFTLTAQSLKSVTIPYGVVSIGNGAFADCSKIESVVIPSSVTRIENSAFEFQDFNIQNIDVYYTGTEEEWQKIEISYVNNFALRMARDGGTIHYNCNIPAAMPPTPTPAPTPEPAKEPAAGATVTPKPKGTTLKAADGKNDYKVTADGKNAAVTFQKADGSASSVTIPETVKDDAGTKYKVTQIAANSFKNNKKIKKVTIGKNVTTIGKNAFNGCKKLKTVTIKSTKIKSIKSGAFKNLPKNATAKVPKSKKKDYKKLLQKAGFKGKVVAK